MKPGLAGCSMRLSCSALGLALLCVFISSASRPAQAFKKVTGARGEMLVGELTKKDLYKHCSEFKENADDFIPDPKAVAAIKGIKDPISILMFLGTWCGDSQRESPKLLKLLDAAKNPRISLTMYGVDTRKDEGGKLAKKYKVERVPTIIFMKGNKELGRIVESPRDTMEADFLAIVGVK